MPAEWGSKPEGDATLKHGAGVSNKVALPCSANMPPAQHEEKRSTGTSVDLLDTPMMH